MVISVKKESEKTLSLSKITKEILEYCDTEAALENLRDEWSKFKDFKNLLKVARYYSPRYYNIKSAGTFGLDEELSFLDKMRKMLSSDGVSKWTDLSKKDKTNYNFLLNEVRDNFDVITRELSRKTTQRPHPQQPTSQPPHGHTTTQNTTDRKCVSG